MPASQPASGSPRALPGPGRCSALSCAVLRCQWSVVGSPQRPLVLAPRGSDAILAADVMRLQWGSAAAPPIWTPPKPRPKPVGAPALPMPPRMRVLLRPVGNADGEVSRGPGDESRMGVVALQQKPWRWFPRNASALVPQTDHDVGKIARLNDVRPWTSLIDSPIYLPTRMS